MNSEKQLLYCPTCDSWWIGTDGDALPACGKCAGALEIADVDYNQYAAWSRDQRQRFKQVYAQQRRQQRIKAAHAAQPAAPLAAQPVAQPDAQPDTQPDTQPSNSQPDAAAEDSNRGISTLQAFGEILRWLSIIAGILLVVPFFMDGESYHFIYASVVLVSGLIFSYVLTVFANMAEDIRDIRNHLCK